MNQERNDNEDPKHFEETFQRIKELKDKTTNHKNFIPKKQFLKNDEVDDDEDDDGDVDEGVAVSAPTFTNVGCTGFLNQMENMGDQDDDIDGEISPIPKPNFSHKINNRTINPGFSSPIQNNPKLVPNMAQNINVNHFPNPGLPQMPMMNPMIGNHDKGFPQPTPQNAKMMQNQPMGPKGMKGPVNNNNNIYINKVGFTQNIYMNFNNQGQPNNILPTPQLPPNQMFQQQQLNMMQMQQQYANFQQQQHSGLGNKVNFTNIIMGQDKRTTLMLRNIPNKYTLNNIVDEIGTEFWGKYDCVNLPIDYETKLNLGYAFVNFTDPFHIIQFYSKFHQKKWSRYKSEKKMDMSYADKQGKKDITLKADNNYFAEDDKRFEFSKLKPLIELPCSCLDFFKKIYPTAVCIKKDKTFYKDNYFYVKSFGKK